MSKRIESCNIRAGMARPKTPARYFTELRRNPSVRDCGIYELNETEAKDELARAIETIIELRAMIRSFATEAHGVSNDFDRSDPRSITLP